MKTTIDAAGRMVIPHTIRRQAGIVPGMPLEIRWNNDRIEIEPQPLPVRLVRQGRLLVAVPASDIEPLTAETVETVRHALADEHADGLL